LAINLVLEWPNDGTTELVFAYMPNGSNMGTVKGECHITDMAYPPQYCDESRNAIMNVNAAH